jgi:predicted aspartyl protease
MTPIRAAKMAVLHVKFTGNLGSQIVDATLDSGAELCCVDYRLITAITTAEPIWYTKVTGMTGSSESPLPVYGLTLELAGQTFQGVEVVAGQQPRHVIGMNLLNRLVLTIDGPGNHFQL